jgi:hypothetical protein
MPSPSTLVLVTARQTQLFIVPLDASPRALQALRPQHLGQQHDSVRVAAYDARTSTLVIAGEGRGSRKSAGPARVSVSAWRLELAGPEAAAAAKLVPLGYYAGSLSETGGGGVNSGAELPFWSRRRWTLSVSALGEHVAVVAPPTRGMLLLTLPQCQRVDPAEHFAGRSAPPASAFRVCMAWAAGAFKP